MTTSEIQAEIRRQEKNLDQQLATVRIWALRGNIAFLRQECDSVVHIAKNINSLYGELRKANGVK